MRARPVLIVALLVCVAAAVPAGALSEAPELGPGGTFSDDNGHPAEPYIEAVVAAGYLGGCDPGDPDRFCPFSRASWVEAERGISIALGKVTRLFCMSSFCSARVVPTSTVAAALHVAPSVSSLGRGADRPINRASLAVMLAVAADLELPDVPIKRSFSIAVTGDILPHSPLMAQANRYADGEGFDFTPMFSDIEPIISGVDLGLCHLETPLSADNTSLSSFPVFFSPREVAEAVAAAGFDGCSTASNHSFDKRTAGVLSTLNVLDDVGLGHSGTTAVDLEPAWSMYDVGGANIAHLSYSYGLNGFRLPSGQPWLVNLIDEGQILADADEVRSLGADFVVVSLHWGNEYQPEPTSYQRDLAAALLNSPSVDVLVGHHAHVVQPVEMINGKYVLYGLGNLVSNQFFRLQTQDGVIAVLDVDEGVSGFAVAGIEFIPTQVERGSYRIIPIPAELASASVGEAGSTLLQSWERTASTLSLLDESIELMVVPVP